MAENIAKPKNVTITSGKGINKMSMKSIVMDFGTFRKNYEKLSEPTSGGIGNISKKSGDKDLGKMKSNMLAESAAFINNLKKAGFTEEQITDAVRAKEEAELNMIDDEALATDYKTELDELDDLNVTQDEDSEYALESKKHRKNNRLNENSIKVTADTKEEDIIKALGLDEENED